MAIIPIVESCCCGRATLEDGTSITATLTMLAALVKYLTGILYLNVAPSGPDLEILAFLKLKFDGYVDWRPVQLVLGVGNILIFLAMTRLAFRLDSAVKTRNPKCLREWLIMMPMLYVDSLLRLIFSFLFFGFVYSIEHIIIVVLFTFSIHSYIVVNSFRLSLQSPAENNELAIGNEIVIPIQQDIIIPMGPQTGG